jgi:outer membrane protein TolC
MVRATAAAFLLLYLSTSPSAGEPARPRSPEGGKQAGEAKVRALLKERLAILKTIAQETDKFAETGRITPEEIVQAKLAVLKAELDLCQSDRERVAVYGRIVAHYQDLENVLQTRVAAGQVPRFAALRARADRLEAEANLERTKARAGAGGR